MSMQLKPVYESVYYRLGLHANLGNLQDIDTVDTTPYDPYEKDEHDRDFFLQLNKEMELSQREYQHINTVVFLSKVTK